LSFPPRADKSRPAHNITIIITHHLNNTRSDRSDFHQSQLSYMQINAGCSTAVATHAAAVAAVNNGARCATVACDLNLRAFGKAQADMK
jgi:hypothetical protein